MHPVGWRDLAHRRDFRRLWLGDAVSLLGDWLTYVAVGVLALQEGGGLWAVALVLAAHTLPKALLAPFAGRLADRVDRRAIMVGVSLIRGVVVLGMAAAAAAGRLGLVQGLLFLRMALGAFVEPAASAALPQLVPRGSLAAANGLLGATWSTVFAVGVALGGLVSASLGAVGALLLDAVTFAAAALILAGLPRLRPHDLYEGSGESARGGRVGEEADAAASAGSAGRDQAADRPAADLHENRGDRADAASAPSKAPLADRGRLRDALAIAWRDRPILEAALAKTPVMLASGGAWVLLHALVGDRTAEGAALALGGLHSARAIGSGIGPILWARTRALAATRLGLHLSAGLTLVAVGLLALADLGPALLAISLLWGLAAGASWVSAGTRVQLLTPSQALGRVASVDLIGYTLGQCVGGLAGALCADALDAPRAAAWVGLGLGGVAWIGLAIVGRGRGR